MNVIKVAVFGAGNMGRNHLRVLSARSDVEIAAVVDPMVSPETKNIAPKAVWCESMNAALDQDFTVAVVAAPTELHFQLVGELLQHGKHVLVEKPAATSEQQCKQLVQAAQQKDLTLAVGNIERMNPAVMITHDLMQSGKLGPMTYFNFRRGGGYPPRIQPGNNVCLDLAVHDFDILSMFCGPIELAQATAAALKQSSIIDIFDATLRSRESFGHVSCDWYSPERRREAQLMFTRGNLVMNYLDQTVTGFLAKELWSDWLNLDLKEFELSHFFGLPKSTVATLSECNDKCWKLDLRAPKINALDVQWIEFQKLLQKQPSRLATNEQLIASVSLAERALTDLVLMPELASKGLGL